MGAGPRVAVSTAAFHADTGLVPRFVPLSRGFKRNTTVSSPFTRIWRVVSSYLSHHPHEVILSQFSLYVHTGGLKSHSFHVHFLTIYGAGALGYIVVSTAAFHARVRGSVPDLGGLKETKLFLPHPRVKVSIVGSLRDREVACSASDRQGSNFESCVWRTVSSQSSHHPQEVLLAQFSLYVHKGGLKPDSFHFIS